MQFDIGCISLNANGIQSLAYVETLTSKSGFLMLLVVVLMVFVLNWPESSRDKALTMLESSSADQHTTETSTPEEARC